MNLLFIHGNFPGQFLDLAPYLARHAADRTVFSLSPTTPRASIWRWKWCGCVAPAADRGGASLPSPQ